MKTDAQFDVVSFILALEQGELDTAEAIDGFQQLIDSGVVWHLQGSYARTAESLIVAGHCKAQLQ